MISPCILCLYLLVKPHIDDIPLYSLPVHHLHRFVRISFTVKLDNADPSILNLGKLNVSNVSEPVFESLPVAVKGEVFHYHSVRGSASSSSHPHIVSSSMVIHPTISHSPSHIP